MRAPFRTLGLFAAVALLLATAAWVASRPARPARPNVLLVSIDTLRADHLGGYGYERDTSPRLDAFAAEGVLFENAFSQSPKTAPSHMSLMTGLYPDGHGVRNLDVDGNRRLARDVPTLAAVLHEAGYRTAAYTGGGHVSPLLGFDEGFDVFEGPGRLDLNVRKAKEFIAAGDAPFFVFLHTYEVHDPYLPPTRYRDMYADPAYDGAVISTRHELNAAVGNAWELQHERFWAGVDPASERDRRHLVDLYDASIRYADDELGGLLDALSASGRARDTIVLFVSDHGEMFGDHDGFLHNALYQEILHVPLLLRVPDAVAAAALPGGAPRGLRVEAPVRLVDVLPTLLELVALPVPAGVHGRSLLPHLRGAPAAPREVLSHWPRDGSYALRVDGWKLIASERTGAVELYDLLRDPSEREDLWASAGDVRARMLARLEGMRAGLRAGRPGAAGGAEGADGATTDVAMDDDARRDLQALGYLGGGN